MRVFVFESITGGGQWLMDPALAGRPAMRQHLPDTSLLGEGQAMLTAVVEDFTSIPGCQVGLLWDARLPSSAEFGACSMRTVYSAADVDYWFRRNVDDHDYCLVIAPELNQQLSHFTRLADQGAAVRLGSSAPYVNQMSDKLVTADLLCKSGIRTPDTFAIGSSQARRLMSTHDCIVKRQDGAGSVQTRRISPHTNSDMMSTTHASFVVQPIVSGIPVSVSLMCGPNQVTPLPACRQAISNDGQYRFLGGSIPIEPQQSERAQRLASAAVHALPGARGYIGIDLLLDHDVGTACDWVVDVNPRMTTSYIGLRHAVRQNLAQLMLDCHRENRLPIDETGRTVYFRANGQVEFE